MIEKLCLCAGRHEMPKEVQGAVFEYIANPMDYAGMEYIANERLKGVEALDLYVTGLTPALVAVINVCKKRGIPLALFHYDASSGGYVEQRVVG